MARDPVEGTVEYSKFAESSRTAALVAAREKEAVSPRVSSEKLEERAGGQQVLVLRVYDPPAQMTVAPRRSGPWRRNAPTPGPIEGRTWTFEYPLPERAVRPPLPKWATIDCSPWVASDVWVLGAEVGSAWMFEGEARAAVAAYVAELSASGLQPE